MEFISDREQYINLSTRKRDGSFIDTPVWFAQAGDGNCFYVFALQKSGKVKRIRNFPDVKIASCSYSGKLTGEWIETSAALVNEAETVQRAYGYLRRKYGLKFRIGDFFSWIIGNYHRRQIIKLRIKEHD
ncbi:MAG: PPOX class F420-dependent oxidoreductase [Rhodospirillaceae bacterium]|jgi:uncharacterized protein|nr:PPOX class F420-dependent oxidoreductase [Rhodospirillaceae bacterium]MBT4689164.1 PPOX class F420-dependent oxidoreductase [Rhodospirillaceae bacterium]MBT5080838.1 PPOX class F420-dependent oxidoreductase [Rhodospirillaceae bacterium]MBT5525259.1 PPOX class F420-dependent oxidoreductase [Rhodospirillaceae bacterium]MBT5877828.1 PPOX class F420-dependent oxidoreductase [Rhodospirillaceae bacterium]